MKKIFLLFITLLIASWSLFADPVSQKETQNVAENFFYMFAPLEKSATKITTIIEEKHQDIISFYIYGFEKGGFVIVSADDDAYPILGYSFTSPVSSDINSNTRFLFDRYKLEIEDAKNSKTKNTEIKQEWNRLKNKTDKSVLNAAGPLLSTTWNQDPYYNQYCPPGTPTGCVATAMSQIMKFHEWPASGNGWHKYTPSDNPQFGVQYADFSSANYDWVNMPQSLHSSSTSDEINAIATLCYHAGVSVDMNYDIYDGSGALTKDVMYAMTSYFKYDPSTIEFIVYDISNETEYLNKIKTEIDASRPIYYDGYGDDGGHAWVCDGYDETNKVHINWGWGGSYNGYFILSNMVAGTYDFTKGNSMIIGIQPGLADQAMLWKKQASAFTSASRGIRYISAVDSRTAWAVAYDGSGLNASVKDFTKTLDGSTWISGTINAEGTDGMESSMITAIDANTAWVALFDGTNGGGKIVKTSDGGLTWENQPTAYFDAPYGFPNVVHFWDENNGWCQGDPNGGYFEMYTTTDGGITWMRVSSTNIPSNQSEEYGTIGYYCVYEYIVWFATNKGRIFKSSDKGLNWVAYQTPIIGASFELSFKNENVGVIQRRGEGDNKIQYMTEDGGKTWTRLNTTGNFYTTGFTFVPETDTLISVGVDYNTPFMGLSYSIDNGATFHEYADFYQNFQFSAVGAAGKDAVWAGTFNSNQYSGGLWHYGNTPIVGGFITDDEVYCTSTDVIFNDVSYGTPDSWLWDFGADAIPATDTGIGPHTVNYSTAGMKTIKLTIQKGSDEHTVTKVDHIMVSSVIPDDASAISGDSEVVAGETHTYAVTSQSNVLFNWEVPSQWTGASTINEIDILFTGASGDGTITVTPTNGCGTGNPSSLDISASPSTGISKIEQNRLNIYPNPASEFITIDKIENTTVYFYDMAGTLVKTEHISRNEPIKINELNNGIYMVVVNSNNIKYSETIHIIK